MKRILSLLVVFLLSGCVLAQAQFTGPQSMNGQPDRRSRNIEQSSQDRFRTFLIATLVNHLELDPDQSEEFFPLWRTFYTSHEEIYSKRQELVRHIMEAIDNGSIDDTGTDTDEFMKQVEEIEKISKEDLELRADFLKRAKKILSDSQYIKLAMFDERLRQEYFDFRGPRIPQNRNENTQ